MRLLPVIVLLMGLAVLACPAGAQTEKAAPEAPRAIRLAPQAAAKPLRALQYRLLPEPGELVAGNAAPLWLRAGQAARNSPRKLTDKENLWLGPAGIPLRELPRQEVRTFLDNHAAAFRFAELAARRDHCDWELPPLTIQTLNDLPFEDIQTFRHLAALLGIRYRLQLSEEHFDEAAGTLRVGLALARDVGNGDTAIHSLVGLAIASLMLGHVEEWLSTPGSPNLYWPLTALPRPLFDLRRSLGSDLATIYRSFPQIREVRAHTLTAERARELLEAVLVLVRRWEQQFNMRPAWGAKMGITLLAARAYPEAKQALIEHGRPAAEVEAMPVLQVVTLHFLDQYDRFGDDFLKQLSLPPWQALPGLEQIEREARAMDTRSGNPLPRLLVRALSKTYAARVRFELNVNSLRCAEALRLYAADHEGRSPAGLENIKAVPLPLDPFTGKGCETYYQVKDGQGVLTVPAPPDMPPSLSRRFELPPPR
jgi:hypothetical protein